MKESEELRVITMDCGEAGLRRAARFRDGRWIRAWSREELDLKLTAAGYERTSSSAGQEQEEPS